MADVVRPLSTCSRIPANVLSIADHVEHFRCAHRSCGVALLDHHFVVGTLPYCERHEASAAAAIAAAAEKVSSSKPARGGAPVVRSTTRSKKRQTIITKR